MSWPSHFLPQKDFMLRIQHCSKSSAQRLIIGMIRFCSNSQTERRKDSIVKEQVAKLKH